MRFSNATAALFLTLMSTKILSRGSGFAFLPKTASSPTRNTPNRNQARFSSAPSDSASSDDDYSKYGYGSVGSSKDNSDDILTIDSDDYEPTAKESMISTILDMMPSLNKSARITTEQRAKINEALHKLEALNPTKSPALSPLLNSVWELRYVGGYDSSWARPSRKQQSVLSLYSRGYSPGIFAYTLARQLPKPLVDLNESIEITIARSQPRIQAKVHANFPAKLLDGDIDSAVTVTARLEVESDLQLRETYEKVQLIGSNALLIPSEFQYTRDLYVTYLDNDLLIVRDGSGVPEVLVRKEKQFSKNWGVEPSALDDMTPPGDGEDAKF